jgi:hypothetical protein
MDTQVHPELINGRFAYVSVSRASQEAQIFTNDATNLADSLSRDVSKTSALGVVTAQSSVPKLVQEKDQIISINPGAGLGLAI